jgi:GNAT superfamily N-acetyltransferase
MLADTPIAFGSSPEDDIACDADGVRRILGEGDSNVIFGAFAPSLVGAVGLFRERNVKAAHKATVWGMYVSPDRRRAGFGRRLLEAAITHARTLNGVHQLGLAVSDDTPGARALYESVGFRRWGTEPAAMHWAGRLVDEHHMVLRLAERDAD